MGQESLPSTAKGNNSTNKKKRPSAAIVNDNESNDNGFANAPKSKKNKMEAEAAPAKKGGDGGLFFELSNNRRITISDFKGKTMVDIREYYEDRSSNSGNMMPGKKGISLPVAQFQTLVTLLPEIEVALKAKGEIVTRPDYGGGGDGDGAEAEAEADGEEEEEEEEEKEEVKEKNNKKGKAKAGGKNSGKENFEATSEEE